MTKLTKDQLEKELQVTEKSIEGLEKNMEIHKIVAKAFKDEIHKKEMQKVRTNP